MKLKATLAFMLCASAFSVHAATELTAEQAQHLEPYKEITVRGEYTRISEAAKAVSKAADKQNADAFFINNIGYHPRNDALWIVSAYLFDKNAAEKEINTEEMSTYKGIIAYPKTKAVHLEPFERVSVRGQFQTLTDMNNAIAKEAEKKDAYAFYIEQFYDVNGSNQQVVAYLYKEDAPERRLKVDDAIPYDSEAGQAALAAGGELAGQVEDPTAYSPTAIENKTSSRYTVKLSDSTRIEELNNATAAKMTAFDSIRFRGTYNSLTAISHAAAKKAAAKGAKYYHITRMVDDRGNGNYTVYVDLYR